MSKTSIRSCVAFSSLISSVISLFPLTATYAQSRNTSLLPTDNDITNILVDGEAWVFGSREYCDTHKLVFSDDGSYGALEYGEGFIGSDGTWHEPNWYLQSSPHGSNFTVENGVLRLHDPRYNPSYSSINAVSQYQLNFIAENDEGQQRSLVNCAVSDQEFVAGANAIASLEAKYEPELVLPSIEHIYVSQESRSSWTLDRFQGYSRRQEGLIDDIVFFDDMYDCTGEARATFGCSREIQSLMDELILRRRRLGPEDKISIRSNYENNCDETTTYSDSRFMTYRFVVSIDDSEPRTGVHLTYSYQAGKREHYFVSCMVPHEQARDVILSGQLFSPLREVHITSIDRWWATKGSDPIDVTLDIEVPEGNYKLDIDIENINTWDLVKDSEVLISGNGNTLASDINNTTGVADLGDLSAGNYRLTIQSFQVPDVAIVEEITFKLSEQSGSQEDDLVTYFVSDHSYMPRNTYQVESLSEPLNSVERLVNYFAPVLYFDERDSIKRPYDVSEIYSSDRIHSSEEDMNFRRGDVEAYIHGLSNTPAQSEGKIYATVLEDDVIIGPTRRRREMAINYYFFYPISNWGEYGGYNTHEGDWEGIVVYLWLDGQVWKPYKVKYANHLSSIEIPWSEDITIDLVQPIVYVGLGGHASYPTSDITEVDTFPDFVREGFERENLEVGIPDIKRPESHRGDIPWNARGNTNYIGRVGDLSSNSWALFSGRWGNPDLDNDGSRFDGDAAPNGPMFLDLEYNVNESAGRAERWLYPWEWPNR